VAAALRSESGTEVEVVDGARGEFTVLVDGREVARKGDELPPVYKVIAAVRKAAPAGKGV
jgi:hypothetical protein